MPHRFPIASRRWLARWAALHRRAAGRLPRRRHLHLARILRLGGADAAAAALATAAACHYEAELQRLGADVEAVAERVRRLILFAALTADLTDHLRRANVLKRS